MFKKSLSILMSVALATSTMIGLSPHAFADDNIQISIKADPKIDVALAAGSTNLELSNFERDLKAKLGSKGIDASKLQVQALEMKSMTAEDTFSWQIYDHIGYSEPYGDSRYRHIEVSNKDIGFYGYTDKAHKDFMFMPDTSTEKKTFTFEVVEQNMDWHTLEGAGFLFNSTITNGNVSGYVVLFGQTEIKLFELNQVNVELLRGGTYNSLANAGTLVSTFPRLAVTSHQVKIEVTPTSINMWDNNQVMINNYQLTSKYGNGFGPFASYTSHACSSISSFTFRNIRMETQKSKQFKEVLLQPIWREGSDRYVVNVDNNVISDFNSTTISGEILTRIINNSADYVAIGSTSNQGQANSFITRNNGNGTFINGSNYSTAIDELSNYIFNKIRSNGNSQYMLLDEDDHLEVIPLSLKENTQTDEYPNGRWKIEHDSEFYENSMGKVSWSGKWQKDIPTLFDKVGRYEIWFGEDHPTPQYLYVHRRPIADFALRVTKGTSDYTITINDKSYDLDMESSSNKGIAQTEWKWRETTATTWTEGMIPASLPLGKDYLVQLRVLDEQGAWSQPLARYVSTGSTALKPIADFQLPTQVTKFKQLNTNDQSYDPAGRVINQKTWTITKNGAQIYTGTSMINDFGTYGSGNYTVALKVKNDINLWSDVFQRNIIVTEDLANPAISFSPNGATWTSESIPVTINFTDDSGINNSLYKVTQSKEEPTSWDTANTDSQKITLANEGQWYIHAKAQDLAGKVTTAVAGPYQIQSKPVTPELKLNQVTQTTADIGWTLPSTTVTEGIQYELVNQTTKQMWTVDYPTDHITNEDLKTGTEYEYVLKAKNNVGVVACEPFKVLTLPAKVESLKIGFKDYYSDQATISFEAVPSATEYKFILFKASKDGQEQVNEQDWKDAGKHSIGDLEAGIQYFATLTAKNVSGYGEATSIGFISLPAAPGEFNIVQVTDQSATLGWLPSETASSYQLMRSEQEVYKGKDLNYTDSGLESATSYNYQLAAKNESGFGDITDLDVLTLPSKVIPKVEKITASTVDLSWDAVNGADKYVVTVDGKAILEVDPAKSKAQVTDLEAGTGYDIAVVAQNASGQSTEDILHVKTLSAEPTNIVAKDISETSVVLHWDTMVGADKYKVTVNNKEYEVATELKLEGLTGDQEYQVTVQSGNESGYSEAAKFAFLTLPSAPAVKIDKVKADVFSATWSKQQNVAQYKIYDEQEKEIATTKELGYTWTKLEVGKTYTFLVSAVNESGEGAKTKVVQQTLPGGWGNTDAELSQIVKVSNITLDSVVLSWKAALGVDQYKIVDVQGNTLGQVQAPTTTLKIEELKSSTSYKGWKLIPLNDAGEGTIAPVPTFNTLTPYYSGNENPIKKEEPKKKEEPVVAPEQPTEQKPYFDDITTSFARSEILELAERGIVKGISDTQFAPNQKVTRVEFASMLVRALELQEASDIPLTFEDIQKSAWYVPELSAAILSGVAHGFSNKEFKPQDPITREQASKMIANAVYDGLMPSGEIYFKDGNSIAVWAKPEVTALSAEKVINGYPDGNFKPKRDLTRAECAVLIYRSLSIID